MKEVVKAIIFEHSETPQKGHALLVRSIVSPDGASTKNTLVKKEFTKNKSGETIFLKTRGLNLSDLLVVKKNWNKIIGSMAL